MPRKRKRKRPKRKRLRLLEQDAHCYFCRRELVFTNSSVRKLELDGSRKKILLCRRHECLTHEGVSSVRSAGSSNNNRRKRVRLYAEDPTCAYCRCPVEFEESTLDHVKARSKGGSNRKDNIVLCCKFCNLHKGNKTVEEFKLEWRYLTLESKV